MRPVTPFWRHLSLLSIIPFPEIHLHCDATRDEWSGHYDDRILSFQPVAALLGQLHQRSPFSSDCREKEKQTRHIYFKKSGEKTEENLSEYKKRNVASVCTIDAQLLQGSLYSDGHAVRGAAEGGSAGGPRLAQRVRAGDLDRSPPPQQMQRIAAILKHTVKNSIMSNLFTPTILNKH